MYHVRLLFVVYHSGRRITEQSKIKMATTTVAADSRNEPTPPMTADEDKETTTVRMTEQEQRRFAKVFSKDSKEKMAAYLAWRVEHQLDEPNSSEEPPHANDDAQLWKWAVHKAWNHQQTNSTSTSEHGNSNKQSLRVGRIKSSRRNASEETLASSRSATDEEQVPCLPQIVFCHRRNDDNDDNDEFFLRDKEGHRVLHILAARLDLDVGNAALYSTALALYLDRLFLDCRHNDNRATLLLDVRPGRGWRNPPALELVGLIRHAAAQLHDLYPDRLHCCILYPVPRPAIWVWNMIKVFLADGIRSAVCLYAGGAAVQSPVPWQQLLQHVDEACLDHCEQARLSSFGK